VSVLPRLFGILTLAAAAAGCLSVYRVDVPQGNVVTQEMLDLLKPGMTPNQVRFVLGTPLVTDPFHKERWDYFYSLRRGDALTAEMRRVTVYFNNDQLARIEGDVQPRSLRTPADEASGEDPAPGN
jgi:outer membrane protein assembly factor BamE